MSQIDPNTGEVLSDTSGIELLLDRLDELKAQQELANMELQAAIDSVLTPEIIEQVEDIKAEFADKLVAVGTKINELETVIKEQCIDHGETIRGKHIQVVYVKGRAGGWDTAKLEGYAEAHPEVLKFKKKDGKPSARIAPVRK